MNSPDRWNNVALWRKREAYIALVRAVLERGSYQQWDCYSFSDYVERQRAGRTFSCRHLPLSDGSVEHFQGLLQNPKHWESNDGLPPPKKRKKVQKSKKAAAASTSADPAAADSTEADRVVPMMWDIDTGKFVPFE